MSVNSRGCTWPCFVRRQVVAWSAGATPQAGKHAIDFIARGRAADGLLENWLPPRNSHVRFAAATRSSTTCSTNALAPVDRIRRW